MFRRLLRKAVLAWESFRLQRKNPALAAAHHAERAAISRRNTKLIHRARAAKRDAVNAELRSAIQ